MTVLLLRSGMRPSCSIKPEQVPLDGFTCRINIQSSSAELNCSVELRSPCLVLDRLLNDLEVGGVEVVSIVDGPLVVFEVQRKARLIRSAE